MEGVPALRDGMPAPKLRTSLHPGGDPDRVERIDKVPASSRGDEQEQSQPDKDSEKPKKVTLVRLASEPALEDDAHPNEAASGVASSAIVSAWAQRAEFLARTSSAGWTEDKRKAMIAAHLKTLDDGSEFEIASVTV